MKSPAIELHPVSVNPRVWYLVGMDLIGPFNETCEGFKYVITMTDYFSKYVHTQTRMHTHTHTSCNLHFACTYSYSRTSHIRPSLIRLSELLASKLNNKFCNKIGHAHINGWLLMTCLNLSQYLITVSILIAAVQRRS